MQEYIPIIFILIFFIGPLLRKMFEGLSGDGGNGGLSSKPSEMEVQEYLKRMRGNQKNRSREYHAPSSRPNKAYQKQGKKRKASEQRQTVADRRRIEDAVQKDIVQHVKGHIGHEEHASQSKKKKVNVLEEKIMANDRFNTFQKAIILQEIINKPKSLLDKNPKDRII